ncbi:hypothetical protein RRG08_059453 [Elysia crispata]|uniref:Uncharacterized protein n=1 Tax=Elysia crispata TaxID=231223 RepID=A0AAE1DS30_9GAST|nr:hypothetical protein RRG08_059453 [Elysia crispata]
MSNPAETLILYTDQFYLSPLIMRSAFCCMHVPGRSRRKAGDIIQIVLRGQISLWYGSVGERRDVGQRPVLCGMGQWEKGVIGGIGPFSVAWVNGRKVSWEAAACSL